MNLLDSKKLQENYTKSKKETKEESKEVKEEHSTDIIKEAASSDKDSSPKVKSDNTVSDKKVEDTKNTPNDSKDNDTSWTLDNALKEIRKLREENKHTRLKFSEKIDETSKKKQQELDQLVLEQEELKEKAKELEALKEQEADKQRSLEEKLDHRSKRVSQLETEKNVLQKEYDEKLKQLDEKVSKYEATYSAQQEVYKERLQEELKVIPEKYKQYAERLIKGSDNTEDALLLLAEAKLNGLFEEKQIVVNHGVPGADNGARLTSEQQKNAELEDRKKMSSVNKISNALKNIRSGQQNSAVKFK